MMNITKSLVSIILLIPYICCFGMFSFGVTFPDKTEVYYDGWLL
jgi:hypothetical protein